MDGVGATLLILSFINFARGFAEKNLTAEFGQNVTLPCHTPENSPVKIAEWSRADSKEYLLLYRDNQLDLEKQEPAFKNRVNLLDSEIKVGDVSLTLQKVTTDDRGRYECRVIQGEPNRGKRAVLNMQPISVINLDVVFPDVKDDQREHNGRYRGHGGLVCVAVIAAAVTVVLAYLTRRKNEIPPIEAS